MQIQTDVPSRQRVLSGIFFVGRMAGGASL